LVKVLRCAGSVAAKRFRATSAAVLAVAILLVGASGIAAAAEPKNPDWCKPGWICVTAQELAERTANVWDLRAEMARLKAKSRRFGWTVGCGLGVAGAIDEDFRARAIPAANCSVIYGLRF
jgi:hypothetical protein